METLVPEQRPTDWLVARVFVFRRMREGKTAPAYGLTGVFLPSNLIFVFNDRSACAARSLGMKNFSHSDQLLFLP